MWESRVLGEISKLLWKPFCGFHSSGISIALFQRMLLRLCPLPVGSVFDT